MIAHLSQDSGTDKSPLVYFPGIDATGEYLLDTESRLAGAFRLICLRYELGPPVPEGADPYGVLAASIVRVFDELGVERPLVLAESFGVGLALRFALDHPQRARGLALVNGFAHYAPAWARWKLRGTTLGARLLPRWAFGLGHRWVAPRALFGPRYTPALGRAFRCAAGGVLDAAYLERFLMIRGLDLRDQLRELELPIALFASDRDRIVPAVRAARVIESAVRDATLTTLPRAGHMVLPLPEEPWVERMRELAERCAR